MELNQTICGDALTMLKTLPDESIDCVITSPPYWALRDYKVEGQLGLEPTFQEYINKLIGVFDEVKRVLKKTGTCWVNLGDTYNAGGNYRKDSNDPKRTKINRVEYGRLQNDKKAQGIGEKSLCQIPARFAIKMTDKGWILRNTIIWHKKNAMPSSVTDRLSNKYELVYFFTKNKEYYFDLDSIRIPFESHEHRKDGITRSREQGYNTKFGTKQRLMEDNSRAFGKRRPPETEYDRNPKGKNPGDVWTLTLEPHKEAHIAMFPEKLIHPMIIAGCPVGGGSA